MDLWGNRSRNGMWSTDNTDIFGVGWCILWWSGRYLRLALQKSLRSILDAVWDTGTLDRTGEQVSHITFLWVPQHDEFQFSSSFDGFQFTAATRLALRRTSSMGWAAHSNKRRGHHHVVVRWDKWMSEAFLEWLPWHLGTWPARSFDLTSFHRQRCGPLDYNRGFLQTTMD